MSMVMMYYIRMTMYISNAETGSFSPVGSFVDKLVPWALD